MDRIEIKGLRAFGRHGVFESEQHDGQIFVVDLSLELDLEAAHASDDVDDTVDYAALAARVADAVASTRFNLIESLAAYLADLVLAEAPVQAVDVRVAKPEAPMQTDLDEVAVVLRRQRA